MSWKMGFSASWRVTIRPSGWRGEQEGQVDGLVVMDEHWVIVSVQLVHAGLVGVELPFPDPGIHLEALLHEADEVGGHEGPDPDLEGGELLPVGVVVAELADVGPVQLAVGLQALHPG